MSPILSRACKGALVLSAIAGFSTVAVAVKDDAASLGLKPYDARLALIQEASLQPRTLAPAMTGRNVVANIQEMSVEANDITGAVGSMANANGFLTDARAGLPMDIAMDFVRSNLTAMGLEASDLAGMRVRDVVYTKQNGVTHIYMQQVFNGMDVYNAQLQVNVTRDGRILNVGNGFVPGLARIAGSLAPRMSLDMAVDSAMKFAGIKAAKPRVLSVAQGPQQATRVSGDGISLAGPINGKLMLLPITPGQVRLVWNFSIDAMDSTMWDMNVDAVDGQMWSRAPWTSSDSYKVYGDTAATAALVESPNHTTPLPPADARTVQTNPANAAASPFGWHDTNGVAGAESTLTIGNNVMAYTDTDANNQPDAGSSPNGGAALNFNFPLDLTQAPSAYRPAAVTNLFYINNIVHDTQFQYGFDEVAGNFQTRNYSGRGAGNDAVRAEAQDGSGTNNANFSTPPDGSPGRMQMFNFTAPTPDTDGDLDATIVVHEYGHGISTRLVGGPSNSSCLTNAQQPGEGLSDWWALVYTGKTGDSGLTGRGVGTYALGQPTSGLGVRTQRYSTDPNVNTFTYANISGLARPHGVGSVFAQAAWEMYWKLVDKYGFDPNLANAAGTAGNQRAMFIVNEGLKNTPCNSSMLQIRDSYLAAAASVRNGEDVCLVWAGFAGVGMGVDAVSGGANSVNPTNGFAVPAMCQGGGGGGATVVFTDDFETDKGWVTNASGTDTATAGAFARGNPQATDSGGVKQQNTTPSGVNALVTGPLAGASAGVNDVDGGVTSIRSPAIALPAGTITMTFNQYLAYGTNATNADFLRVTVQGTSSSAVVFQRVASATNVNAAYAAATANLSAFAGQTVRILVEVADAGTASLVEGAIDDVRITRQ